MKVRIKSEHVIARNEAIFINQKNVAPLSGKIATQT